MDAREHLMEVGSEFARQAEAQGFHAEFAMEGQTSGISFERRVHRLQCITRRANVTRAAILELSWYARDYFIPASVVAQYLMGELPIIHSGEHAPQIDYPMRSMRVCP